jgi:probable rRNA maturation factor
MPPKVSLHRLTTPPEARQLPGPRAFARALERAGAASGEVALVLTDARHVRRLHRDYAGEDRDTDVLAFEYGPADGARRRRGDARARARGSSRSPRRHAAAASPSGAAAVHGDVFVNADAARRQAAERGLPAREELARLFLHGCLHLLGWRDATPAAARRMEAVQESLLLELLGRRGRRPRG